MSTEVGQLQETTQILDRPAERDAFWEEHGYLFFRKAFNTTLVEELRGQIVQEMKSQGAVGLDAPTDHFLLKSRHDVNEVTLHEKVNYDTFWNSGLKLFESVLGAPVTMFRNTQMRYGVPDETLYTTPPHQDGGQVPGIFCTVWVALMDIPIQLGGLALADGSHKGGLREYVSDTAHMSYSTQKPFEYVPLGTIGEPWLSADFKAGDAIVFHRWLLHRALPNHSDRVRLSVDTRFAPASLRQDYVTHRERAPDFAKYRDRYIAEKPIEQMKKVRPR